MKSLTVADYLAWSIILILGLAIIAVVFGGPTIVSLANLSDPDLFNPFLIGVVMLRVLIFLYPIVIIRQRIRTGSYAFLNQVVHYIALPLCVLLWAGLFIQ